MLSSAEFRKVYKRGRCIEGGYGIFLYLLENPSHQTRIGITIARGSVKLNAVKRNRTKRIIKGLFQHHKIEIRQGFDMAIKIKPRLPVDREKIAESVRCLLKEAGLFP